jgi:solute carrier family 35 protein E1
MLMLICLVVNHPKMQGFAHVLKSMEPAFTALFSGLLTGKWQHPAVYATLVPVMGGVAYASASELNFNMLQFVAAMVSNIGFSLRAVIGKQIMSDSAWDRKITKLDGPNTFSVMQLGSTIITLPFVFAIEGWKALVPWMHPNW